MYSCLQRENWSDEDGEEQTLPGHPPGLELGSQSPSAFSTITSTSLAFPSSSRSIDFLQQQQHTRETASERIAAKVRQLIEQLSPEELKRADDEAKRVRAEQLHEYRARSSTENEILSEESTKRVRDRNMEPALESDAEVGETEADGGLDPFGIVIPLSLV